MDRILGLLRRNQKKLMKLENVVGVGMGYKIVQGRFTNKPAIMVLVKKKLPEKELKSRHIIPTALGEVPTDVLEVGEIRLLASRIEGSRQAAPGTGSSDGKNNVIRTARARPARPGMSIGHYKVTAGTFGAVVKDEKTGELLILSNNHVLANATNGRDGKSAVGDPILQPGSYDGGTASDVIAYLERFVPIEKDAEESRCPVARNVENVSNIILGVVKPDYRVSLVKKASSHNLIDAAVAKPVKAQFIEPDIFELGKINGIAEPRIGLQVKKSGRTSGVTTAEIKALDVVLRVMLGPSEEATFYEQILTGPMAQPGDSGSLVVDDGMNAVGLLFAGSDRATIINPIANVMKLLKVTF
ncbi:hypothetical protein [Thermoanaerobacterium sp. DL9XJH110]|jgi:hypothetical protein|uniref:hypothetical protein n=1 Tax=Thermoanaerobacterium sp. DL9XJH110 TaxID=3386643 RepID=UPI003BB53403